MFKRTSCEKTTLNDPWTNVPVNDAGWKSYECCSIKRSRKIRMKKGLFRICSSDSDDYCYDSFGESYRWFCFSQRQAVFAHRGIMRTARARGRSAVLTSSKPPHIKRTVPQMMIFGKCHLWELCVQSTCTLPVTATGAWLALLSKVEYSIELCGRIEHGWPNDGVHIVSRSPCEQ